MKNSLQQICNENFTTMNSSFVMKFHSNEFVMRNVNDKWTISELGPPMQLTKCLNPIMFKVG